MNTHPLVLGISGNRGVGKDTLCSHLCALNPHIRRIAFADRLKEDVAPLIQSQFGYDSLSLTPEQKEIVRHLYIGYGMAWRAKDPLHWVKIVANQIEDEAMISPTCIHCVTDFRFTNEVQFFRERFGDEFRLVNVVRDGAPAPTEEEEKHFRQVSAMADYRVEWGHDNLADQQARVYDLMGTLHIPILNLT